MASAKGFKGVAFVDTPGGGQVVVDGNYAYVGHTVGPEATTIFDVSDPKNPRQVHQINCQHNGVHAHKVRVQDGLMITNYEWKAYAGDADPDFRGGLNMWDVSDPTNPKHIAFWECAGCGVHRFTYDGRYAYISPEMDGYIGAIVVILDLKDPAKPEEVGRWWYPGQHIAGGEEPTWEADAFRCHHPMRMGNRLYTSYWHAGFVILDIEDMSKPKFISGLDWSPPFAFPTHTCLPIPDEIMGDKWMLVADEDAGRLWKDSPGAMMWMVNITDETNPIPVSTVQLDSQNEPLRSGCHQPIEEVRGTDVPTAWFRKGVQLIDFSNPYRIESTGHYIPDPAPGCKEVLANDVCYDDQGLVYMIDRDRGLHIIERT
jgi:hypothetical protein